MSGQPDLTGARWRTSSYTAEQEHCVEVAPVHPVIAVRDSKDRQGPSLAFGESAWTAFLTTVKSGTLDLA